MKKLIEEVIKKHKIDVDDYEAIGWRSDKRVLPVGAEVGNSADFWSRDIDEAIDTNEAIGELPGASTYGVYINGELDTELIRHWDWDRIACKPDLTPEDVANQYTSDTQFYLIGGSSAGWGHDPGERVISEAVVLAVLPMPRKIRA